MFKLIYSYFKGVCHVYCTGCGWQTDSRDYDIKVDFQTAALKHHFDHFRQT